MEAEVGIGQITLQFHEEISRIALFFNCYSLMLRYACICICEQFCWHSELIGRTKVPGTH